MKDGLEHATARASCRSDFGPSGTYASFDPDDRTSKLLIVIHDLTYVKQK